jgi:hypothetical protein
MLLLKYRLELMRNDIDDELQPVTRIAAHTALFVLNKYLKIMEESDVYWMATGMYLIDILLLFTNHMFYTSIVSLV